MLSILVFSLVAQLSYQFQMVVVVTGQWLSLVVEKIVVLDAVGFVVVAAFVSLVGFVVALVSWPFSLLVFVAAAAIIVIISYNVG